MTDSRDADGATYIKKMAMAEMHASSFVFSSLEKFFVYWWRPALAPCRCFQDVTRQRQQHAWTIVHTLLHSSFFKHYPGYVGACYTCLPGLPPSVCNHHHHRPLVPWCAMLYHTHPAVYHTTGSHSQQQAPPGRERLPELGQPGRAVPGRRQVQRDAPYEALPRHGPALRRGEDRGCARPALRDTQVSSVCVRVSNPFLTGRVPCPY